MRAIDFFNISNPIISTFTTAGLLYHGVGRSFVGKVVIVASSIAPVFLRIISNAEEDQELQGLKRWSFQVMTFGFCAIMGAGAWRLLESDIIATIIDLALSIFSNIHLNPVNPGLHLILCAGFCITALNIGLAVDAYHVSQGHDPVFK